MTASSRKFFVVLWIATVFAVAGHRSALARDQKAAKKIEDMNRTAMEDYDLLEFESAKKQLNEALSLVKKGKLTKHPVAARTHFNLAIVFGGGLGDNDTALLEFIAALEIDPKLALDPAYKTPELQKLFEQARSSAGAGGGGAAAASTTTTTPPPPPPPTGGGGGAADTGDADDVEGLQHTPVDEAPAGRSIAIQVKVGSDVGAKQVVLYFRPQGAEEFRPVPMHASAGGGYQADIPASATQGGSVHYYVEAKNAAGKIAASSGNAGSPNIVMISGGSGATAGGDDSENPLGEGGGDASGGDDETTVGKSAGPHKKKVYFAVALGTGGGYVAGTTEAKGAPVKCCVAPAPFHVMPELGFWLNDEVTLSAYARIGLLFGADVPNHASAAPAALVRVGYHMGRHGEIALHGDIGGGLIRRNVRLEDVADMNVDTQATGPLLFGGGASFGKDLSEGVRFLADANVLVGLPIVDTLGTSKPAFGVNLDLNLGIALAF